MERKPVLSSNIASVGYDPEEKVLEIEFKGGAVYAYDGVPEPIHDEFFNAKSIGKHFHTNIKDRFKTRKLK